MVTFAHYTFILTKQKFAMPLKRRRRANEEEERQTNQSGQLPSSRGLINILLVSTARVIWWYPQFVALFIGYWILSSAAINGYKLPRWKLPLLKVLFGRPDACLFRPKLKNCAYDLIMFFVLLFRFSTARLRRVPRLISKLTSC